MLATNITEKEDARTGEITELSFQIFNDDGHYVAQYREFEGQVNIEYSSLGHKELLPIVEEKSLPEVVSELLQAHQQEIRQEQEEIDEFMSRIGDIEQVSINNIPEKIKKESKIYIRCRRAYFKYVC
jgi:hypothetical protein